MRLLFVFFLRLILLAAFTFGFVVLFEHGPAKFSEGARTEWNALLFFVGSVISKQPKAPARDAPDAGATPSSSPSSTPSPTQKASSTGTGTNAGSRTPAPQR